MHTYLVIRDVNGVVIGIQRDDGAMIPMSPGNKDFRTFVLWNAQQPAPDDLRTHRPAGWQARRPRDVFAVLTDLVALNSADLRKVQLMALAIVLVNDPTLARRAGVAIDGDEPVP
jgi:hypothetical protein